MALMECPACGHKVSSRDEECSKCGSRLNLSARKKRRTGGSGNTKLFAIVGIGVAGLVVCLLCGGGTGAYFWFTRKPADGPVAKNQADDWPTFNDPNSKASVQMPQKPVSKEKGGVVLYKVVLGKREFIYTSIQLTPELRRLPPNQVLDKGRNGAVERMERVQNARLVSEKTITHEGIQGRELKFSDAETTTGRYFVAKDRMFMLIVSGDIDDGDVRKFFGSLKFDRR